jgi:hypothetical protein
MNSLLHSLMTRAVCGFGALFLAIAGHSSAASSEDIAKEIQQCTVRVVIFGKDDIQGHGSGFFISSQGHVATNRHVIEKADSAVVVFSVGDRVFIRSADLVTASSTADLAILKIDPLPSARVVKIANIELAAGQEIMTVGFPGALDSGTWASLDGVEMAGKSGEGRITTAEARNDFVPAVFPGAVAKNLTDAGVRMVLHSAKVSGGNSGGPLIDAEGRVCGINTALLPASMAGVDYPISIHSAELIALARAHSIPIEVSSSKATSRGSLSGIHLLLYIVIAAFAVVMFLMVLRKPRAVMVNAMSHVVRSRKHAPAQRQPAPASAPNGFSAPSAARGNMRLRGRDPLGLSYDLTFSPADFQRHGKRLVIGRNNDLSQLVVSHDSVSRQHATLILNGSSVQVEDRNSGNGTKLNGSDLRVGQPAVSLNPGDKLTLGEVDLIFEIFH